jgi:cobalt-zinc-cadmium efflux system membrane fusion protein
MKLREILFVLLTVLAVSCQTNNNVPDTKETENPKVRLTNYSSDFELYAEADPFVAGKTGNILSHFSTLPDFKALDNAQVSIHLFVGDNEISQLLEKPTRKGIFSFDLEPTVSGNGRIVFKIKTTAGNYELVVPLIDVYSNKEEADSEASKLVPSRTNTIVFTKEQSWKIDFSTDLPIVEPFGQVIKTTAQIQPALGDEVMVSAKAGGTIIFSEVNVLEGQFVSAGASLFTILGAGLAENNSSVRFNEAQNNYLKAKADIERQESLAKDKIISEKELLVTRNEYENAKAVYEMLNSNFNVSGQVVSSPSSGFIKQLFVKNGQYVEAGQPLISVSKNKILLLKADIQQKYSAISDKIKSANIKTPGDDKTYTLEQLNGKVLSVGRNTNSDNYLIPISLQIDNSAGFTPGGFVEVYLKAITNNYALVVPNTSLLEEQGNFFVFVQITPELFEKREVKVGPTDGLFCEIIAGLNPNDRIVSKGTIMVKLAQASGALDPSSGHNH